MRWTWSVSAQRNAPTPGRIDCIQSAWVYETLSPHVDELVVAGIAESRGPKRDKLAAYWLADDRRQLFLPVDAIYPGRSGFPSSSSLIQATEGHQGPAWPGNRSPPLGTDHTATRGLGHSQGITIAADALRQCCSTWPALTAFIWIASSKSPGPKRVWAH